MKGKDVQVGDDLAYLGKAYRITDIEPLDTLHYPEGWRVAYSRRPDQLKLTARNRGAVWGITLSPDTDYDVTRGSAGPPYPDAAVHLYEHLKRAGVAPGDWNGGDTVQAVCEWLTANGVDVDTPEEGGDE